MTFAISIDLETLSTHKNAVVVTIGASTISHEGPEDWFLVRLNMQDQIDRGRHVSADTIRWWMFQNETAKRNTFQGGNIVDVELGMVMFSHWLQTKGGLPVWSKGPAFDGAIIESLCEDYGLPSPIGYRDHRDIRTIEDAVLYASANDELSERYFQMEVDTRNKYVAHDAVQDSMQQGDVVRWWYKELKR